jgi:hypothetical protein
VIDTIRWILIAFAVPVIIILVITTVRHARSLSERIDEHFKEEEEKKQSGKPINPYDDMSRIMDTRPKPERRKRKDDQ